MNLKELQRNWDTFGRTDPLWAILTLPGKKGNKWQQEEFFQTGRQEIGIVIRLLRAKNLSIEHRSALDFGCGVGRLTQALAEHFDEVHGVDIAPSMIASAREYNRFGDRCEYHLNHTDDLALFADNTFDLVYTNITLHHMEPKYALRYLREFMRVLRQRGVLIFYMLDRCPVRASELPAPGRLFQLLGRFARRAGELFSRNRVLEAREPVMEAYGISREEMRPFLRSIGGNVVDLIENNYRSVKEVFGEFDEGGYIEQIFASDPDPQWTGYWCITTKGDVSP